jgi:hypothetical protein
VKGRIQHTTKPDNLQYSLNVAASNLDVGTIIQDNQNFGKVTAVIQASGRGVDVKKASSKFSGDIQSAVINNYNYKNLHFDGNLAQQVFELNAKISDPNIQLVLEAGGNVGGEFPSLRFDATIDSIRTLPLHFSQTPIAYRGKISGNFTTQDPDNLQGKLFLTQSILTNSDQRFQIDTIMVDAGKNEKGNFLTVTSDAFSIALEGAIPPHRDWISGPKRDSTLFRDDA